jgi:hypothetical protein
MDGYDFITAVDDKQWGNVVGRQDGFVIVEHGTLRKHRYAVPEESVEVDEEAKEVRTSLSGELIGESPRVDDGFDRDAIARHYGLVDTSIEYESAVDDPARGPEYQEHRAGVETSVEGRARIREASADETDAMPDESPALLGDRLSDVGEDEPRR